MTTSKVIQFSPPVNSTLDLDVQDAALVCAAGLARIAATLMLCGEAQSRHAKVYDAHAATLLRIQTALQNLALK